jgi:hypothetical protein
MPGIKSKGVAFTSKYWFARGYYSKMVNEDNPPSIEIIEYCDEMLNIDISEEYKKGVLTAQRDKVNGLA